MQMIWRTKAARSAAALRVRGRRGTRIFVDACLGEELEELELAQRAETKESVLERQDLFDGDFATGGLVDGCHDCPVCSFSEAVKHTVVVAWESGRTYVRQLAGMVIGI